MLKCDCNFVIRSILGPELIIISLSMTMEDQVERLRKRHFGDESAVEMMKVSF